MAAEYEVNIKINSQQIERQLQDIDKAISKIGKPKGGGSRGKSGISSLSPTREDLKASADYQKALQGVLKAGRDAEKVFGNLRKTAQSAMVAGANEARQLAAAAAGAPLKSQIRTRPQSVTRASADAAAKQLEAQIRAAATLEKQMVQEVAAFEMRADKRVLEAGLNNDKIEFKQKINDIVRLTDLSIKESKREGKAFDEELRRRDRARRATQTDRKKRLEGVALGAGFPLLFGGGAGSVIGGGLGGLTGSFGAQIAFSAIGQQIDQFIGSITETGKAFGSLEGVLELIRERSLFTSKSSEELARQLEELGDVEGLAELATIELASKIGTEGIEAFQGLETEIDEFDRLVGHLMISLQAFLAGPLGNFLEIVNATLGKKVTQGTIDRLAESLQDPVDRTRFRAAAKERIGTELEIQGFGMGGLPRSAEVLKSAPLDLLSQLSREVAGGEFGKSNLLSRPLKVTQQDREVFKPKSIKPDREAEKAAREEARIQKRLKNLEEERKKIIEISRFKDKIASAEAARDEQLVIRLKGEQQVAEIEAKRKQSLIDITDQRLIDAINVEAATEKLATQRDTERELVELQRQKDQQRMDDMQRFIEQQYELNEAVKQQLALADGIAQVMGKGMAESFDLLISGAKNWGAALKDIAANVLRDIARQLIQIYVIEQAVGFLRNFLTPFDPSTPLGAGSGQIGKFGTLGPNYGISQFANGGNPPVGRPSIVGERGPELFVPNTAGTIIPNHAMGGANIVVNVDASGSQAQGNEPNAKALGAALGAAVQAELIKQKRPGGLLS